MQGNQISSTSQLVGIAFWLDTHIYFYYYKAIIKCYKHSYIVTK